MIFWEVNRFRVDNEGIVTHEVPTDDHNNCTNDNSTVVVWLTLFTCCRS